MIRHLATDRFSSHELIGLAVLGVLLTAPSVQAGGSVHHAAPSDLGLGDCSSWANACDLQQALATASAVDQIWLLQGTYTPGPNREDSFVLPAGTNIYGGFDGSESSAAERDPATNVTILSGDIGVVGDMTDNSHHVVDLSSATVDSLLDGVTITGGYTPESWPDYHGAGVYCNGMGGGRLWGVTVTGNSAFYHGGGLYSEGCDIQVRDSTFADNEIRGTDGDGGAINGWQGTIEVVDSLISGNNGRLGGGIYAFEAAMDIRDTHFEANTASNSGGGLHLGTFTPGGELTGLTFVENTADYSGGFECSVSGLAMSNLTFIRNSAATDGGGMRIRGGGSLTDVRFFGNTAGRDSGGLGVIPISDDATAINNALFVGNTVGGEGGGMYTRIPEDAMVRLTNATFVANHAVTRGGGLQVYGQVGGNPATDEHYVNSIFRGNSTDGLFGPQIGTAFDQITVSSSIVEGGYAGTNVSDVDPLFVRLPAPGGDATWGTSDDDYGDLRVMLDSPAVDSGDSSVVTVSTDLAGEVRIWDHPSVVNSGLGPAPVDLGPYERHAMFADGFESGDTLAWSGTVE